MIPLGRDDLHASLGDPVLGSIGFLNEVMARYPDAISFAPGAPNPVFVEELDIGAAIERYLEHLGRSRGIGRDGALRLVTEYGPSRGLIGDLVAA
ncbi:PLP-dependent aminotransferase family protein, partial [Streptosporangium algeriense]